MKRRSKAGGEPIKGRRRKTPGPKRRNAPKAAARSSSPPTGKAEEFARLARELGEAIERQTATTEVLQVINSSCGDLQPVFQTMLAKAVRLCQATFGVLWLAEGDRFRSVALHNLPPAFAAARQRDPVVYFGPKSGTGRLIEKKQIFQIEDLTKDPGYIERDPRIIPLVELGGARTALFAPLLQKNHVIGSLVLYRQEVCPFGDKQIALVENFAAQAVIAIENARLLNELRQRTTDLTERTADLTEALDQQTATSEVLQVISSSPGDLEPVFQAMLENATRICEAKFGVVFSFDGNEFHVEAQVGAPPEFAEYLNRARPLPQPLPGSHLDRLRQTKRISYTADYAAEGIPAPPVTLGGARSTVDVPMLKDNELVGAFSIYRQEVRPFTEKQIDLVKNFAAQAVIASRTRGCSTNALADSRLRTPEHRRRRLRCFEVISAPPAIFSRCLKPCWRTLYACATPQFGTINRWEATRCSLVATHNAPLAFAEAREAFAGSSGDPNNLFGSMVATKAVVHVDDASGSSANEAIRSTLQQSNLAACGRVWQSLC